MDIQFKVGTKTYQLNSNKGVFVSIPLNFEGKQPNAFGAPTAKSNPLQIGSFTGDVRTGAGCNCETYSLTPHCNGSHTESVGHITAERISVASLLMEPFVIGQLISVEPKAALESLETYSPPKQEADLLITRESLIAAALPAIGNCLAIRTLPNAEAKMYFEYSYIDPPFFSIEAMRWIVEQGIEHLLLDVPSVDRAADEGLLTCHHLFWTVAQGQNTLNGNPPSTKTISEFLYFPNSLPDGYYAFAVQFPHFLTDAAPARVIAYPLVEIL